MGDTIHKDRCLITPFVLAGVAQARPCFVVNCHLSAGPEGPRRLRQIMDAAEAIRKITQNKKPHEESGVVVFVGDMNAEASEPTGVATLLEAGEVRPEFLEDGNPVTTKAKQQVKALI